MTLLEQRDMLMDKWERACIAVEWDTDTRRAKRKANSIKNKLDKVQKKINEQYFKEL